jgi:hypothetical protein
MLFDETSTLYNQGYDFLEKLSTKILSEFDYIENIKRRLGLITDEEIERDLISKLNLGIKTGTIASTQRKGKALLNLYKQNLLDETLRLQINSVKEDSIKKLKQDSRKNSSIRDRSSFESYIYELVSHNSFSVESIVQQLARRIYEDAKANSSRTKTKKLWQELNIELEKYRNKEQFSYEVIAPSVYSSNYEITFTSSID